MAKIPVCLINPPTTDPAEERSYFPMALLALGGVLKSNQIAAQLWDFDLFFKRKGNLSEAEFRELLHHGMEATGAEVYCISSVCSNFPMAIWLAREIKRYNKAAMVLLGGPQPSSVPERIIEEFDFIDGVAVGEGEVTLQELIDQGFSLAALKKTPGIVTRDEDTIIHNPKRKLLDDLDLAPMPDYSLIDFTPYKQQRRGDFLVSLEVGRGCPFHCTFCSTSVMWGQKYRVKSPERIYQEMRLLYENFGFKSFEFIHDNFTTSRKFVNDFSDYMIQHNKDDLHWYCASRTDCISIPLMDHMYAGGLRWLFFGIETGSNRMQQVIKKNLDFAKFDPILRHGNKIGVESVTAFILGFPEETLADIDETVQKALDYKNAGTASVFIAKLSPLAGSSIYRDYLAKLKELSHSSTLSPQNYGLPYIKEIIAAHPDLFSSFYHVPHPEFPLEALTKLVEFSHLLVNGNSDFAGEVLKTYRLSPTQLFSLWDEWAVENQIPYDNYHLYPESRFTDDFYRFVQTCEKKPHMSDQLSGWTINMGQETCRTTS